MAALSGPPFYIITKDPGETLFPKPFGGKLCDSLDIPRYKIYSDRTAADTDAFRLSAGGQRGDFRVVEIGFINQKVEYAVKRFYQQYQQVQAHKQRLNINWDDDWRNFDEKTRLHLDQFSKDLKALEAKHADLLLEVYGQDVFAPDGGGDPSDDRH